MEQNVVVNIQQRDVFVLNDRMSGNNAFRSDWDANLQAIEETFGLG